MLISNPEPLSIVLETHVKLANSGAISHNLTE
jgi:hypothetical protein